MAPNKKRTKSDSEQLSKRHCSSDQDAGPSNLLTSPSIHLASENAVSSHGDAASSSSRRELVPKSATAMLSELLHDKERDKPRPRLLLSSLLQSKRVKGTESAQQVPPSPSVPRTVSPPRPKDTADMLNSSRAEGARTKSPPSSLGRRVHSESKKCMQAASQPSSTTPWSTPPELGPRVQLLHSDDYMPSDSSEISDKGDSVAPLPVTPTQPRALVKLLPDSDDDEPVTPPGATITHSETTRLYPRSRAVSEYRASSGNDAGAECPDDSPQAKDNKIKYGKPKSDH